MGAEWGNGDRGLGALLLQLPTNPGFSALGCLGSTCYSRANG